MTRPISTHFRVPSCLALLLLTSARCGFVESRDRALRIATWNVHNFYNTVSVDTEPALSVDDYQSRLSNAVAVLMALDADLVVLQEVETPNVLQDLAFAIPSSVYDAHSTPGNDPRRMQIGLLSRIPVHALVSHRDDSFDASGAPAASSGSASYRYARDCIEVHVDVAGDPFVLLGVHFKSKAEPDDPEKRFAEAMHTRRIADALLQDLPAARLVVAGDINDVPGAAPYRALIGEEPLAFVSVTSALRDAWSYEYAGQHELIDHQFMSPGLVRDFDVESVVIDHGRTAGRASDHAPLAATYRLR